MYSVKNAAPWLQRPNETLELQSPGLMWVVRVPGWVAALSPLPPTPAE